MNYGIQASEHGHKPAAVLWDWVAASNGQLVVFLETIFELTTAGLEDKTLCAIRVGKAGHVIIDPEHPEEKQEFGRYLPKRKGTFIRICESCMCRNQVLVAPVTITDQQAVRILEGIFEIWDALLRNSHDDRPIGPIIRWAKIPIAWAYLIGFYVKLPLTHFLSEDQALVDDFEKHSQGYGQHYEVQERW